MQLSVCCNNNNNDDDSETWKTIASFSPIRWHGLRALENNSLLKVCVKAWREVRNIDPLPGLLGTRKQMCQHWVTWCNAPPYLVKGTVSWSACAFSSFVLRLQLWRKDEWNHVLCSAFLALLCFSLIKFRLLWSSKYCIFLRNIVVME